MRILSLFTLLFISTLAFGQEESSGSFILGGSVGFRATNNPHPFVTTQPIGVTPINFSYSTADTKYRSLILSPYVGRQLNERWTLGVSLLYQKEKFADPLYYYFNLQDPVNLEIKTNQAGAELFARYTFNPQNKFNLFVEPSVAYVQRNEKEYRDHQLTFKEKSWYLSAGIRIGALYQVSDAFRITARSGSLSYNYGEWELGAASPGFFSGNSFSNFQANLNLSSVILGVEVKL